MNSELSIVPSNQILNYSNEQVDLIKKTVAIGATDLELKMFLAQCTRTGLDALTRQIYFIKDKKGKVQIQTSIDGFRLIAERSDKYEGQTKPEWCGEDGQWKDIWLNKEPPKAARVGVYKRGFREALYAVALFDEYCQTNYEGHLTFMWNKMPSLMISKVAESLALRKAFPNEIGGLYTKEEMAQASVEQVELEDQNKPVVASAAKEMALNAAISSVKSEKIVEVAPKPVDPRVQLGVLVNKERERLGWTGADIGASIQKMFNKPSNQLTIDEMNQLLTKLQSQE